MPKTYSAIYENGKLMFENNVKISGKKHVIITVFEDEEKDNMTRFDDTQGVDAHQFLMELDEYIGSHGKTT